MKKLIFLLIGTMLMAGCATTNSVTDSAFLGEYSKNLKPGSEEGGPKMIWIDKSVNFTKYKKVMVDYVIFSFADDSEYKGIDANTMKEIADAASLALVTRIQQDFPVVSQPGPDVLRVRTAITDLRQSKPVISGVTSVIPVGIAISLVKKGATDSWSGSGATTAEMMVLDSMTNQVIGAGVDERAAGFTERFTRWGSATDAFEFWADRFTHRLIYMTKKN